MSDQTNVAALVERLRRVSGFTGLNGMYSIIQEAAAALTAAQERVTELEADLETLGKMHDNSDALMSQMERAERTVKAYREALEEIENTAEGHARVVARQALSDTQPENVIKAPDERTS
jgi:hypothetical protein